MALLDRALAIPVQGPFGGWVLVCSYWVRDFGPGERGGGGRLGENVKRRLVWWGMTVLVGVCLAGCAAITREYSAIGGFAC